MPKSEKASAGSVHSLFATRIYRAGTIVPVKLTNAIEALAMSLAVDDSAGLRWCEKHGYPGYTSYASLNDLGWRFPEFAHLTRAIERHALAFARQLHWDLRGMKPRVDSLWVNVMPEGGAHSSHIHPNAVLSGTFYVAVPPGSGPIVYEDPRLGFMMAAPPKQAKAPRAFRTHVSFNPEPGTLMLWESWLRHEVPLNRAEGHRISVSFNCVLA